jgi:hypothetical protein
MFLPIDLEKKTFQGQRVVYITRRGKLESRFSSLFDLRMSTHYSPQCRELQDLS